MMVCELCKEKGKETLIPYDEIGIELMKAHLEEEHNVHEFYLPLTTNAPGWGEL